MIIYLVYSTSEALFRLAGKVPENRAVSKIAGRGSAVSGTAKCLSDDLLRARWCGEPCQHLLILKWLRENFDQLMEWSKVLLCLSCLNGFFDQVIAWDENRVGLIHFGLACAAINRVTGELLLPPFQPGCENFG